MKKFLDIHKNNLIQLIESKKFTPQKELVNTLLRYILHKVVMFNAQPEGVSVQLNDFRSALANPLDTSSNLSNPFEEKEDE